MRSIRGRLTLLLVISLGLLLVGSGGVLYTIIRAQLIGEFDRVLLAKAQALITLTDDNGQTVEIDIADKFMPKVATVPSWLSRDPRLPQGIGSLVLLVVMIHKGKRGIGEWMQSSAHGENQQVTEFRIKELPIVLEVNDAF